MINKEKVLVITGPTAVGKTKLSIGLAKRFSGEIISGDSMQVYRGMDIGTAKVTKEEMEGVPHHLIDMKDPEESFSVAEYQKLVRNKITEITCRNKIPIIVGGTGLYIQSVLYDYHFENNRNPALRKKLEKEAETFGVDFLYRKLMEIDPATAKKIHPNNERRVIRALEIYYTTGTTMSEIKKKQMDDPLYDMLIIGLTMDREKLYERINERIELMIEKGLLDEAEKLYRMGLKEAPSTQAIGYKELFDYFEGNCSLEEAVEQMKQNTRRFAKRQYTWFKNKMPVTWFDLTDRTKYDKIFEKICDCVAGKFQLKANK